MFYILIEFLSLIFYKINIILVHLLILYIILVIIMLNKCECYNSFIILKILDFVFHQ